MSIHQDIPEVCYAFEEVDCRVIGILRGEIGYRGIDNLPQHLAGNASASKAWVDNRNNAMGVTPAQREAMIAGSMFGWNLLLVDPAKFPNARNYVTR